MTLILLPTLGTYCCIAKNSMGEISSTTVLTLEDIQSQLTEEERLLIFAVNQPPYFVKGLSSHELQINDEFKFHVQGIVVSFNLITYRPKSSCSTYPKFCYSQRETRSKNILVSKQRINRKRRTNIDAERRARQFLPAFETNGTKRSGE